MDAERQVRIELAAMYRLFHHYGWSDLTYTHLCARVAGDPPRYLINPYGLLFDEVTASNLLLVDFDGNVVRGDHPYNRAGHVIHTAVLRARPELRFVLHSHTRAAVAVSAMRDGLLPLSQQALVISGTLAYHAYGVAAEEDAEEGERVVRDLGSSYAMLLQNHGMLVCGRTAAEAFLYHYFLQSACEIQVDVLRAGTGYVTPAEEPARALAAWGAPREKPWGGKQWAALLRMLERRDPSFAD